jgi:hypothetical protein
MRFQLLLPLVLLLPACQAAPLQPQSSAHELAIKQFDLVQLQVSHRLIEVQLADNTSRRGQGLMGQSPLLHGMLLLQDEIKPMVLWMKNTPEPLDVAFISPDWTIVSIKQMEAYSETRHPSGSPVIAALEMPLGWFTAQNIQIGSKIIYCPAMPTSCTGQPKAF